MKDIIDVTQATESGLFIIGGVDLAAAAEASKRLSQPVLYISGEDTLQKSVELVGHQAGIGISELNTGKLEPDDWDKLITAAEEVGEIALYIDTDSTSHDELKLAVFEVRRKLGIRHIFICDTIPSEELDSIAVEMGALIFI
jgi:replicative DNA helicase